MMRVYFRGKRSYYHCTKDKLNTYPPLENAPFAAAVRRAGYFVGNTGIFGLSGVSLSEYKSVK